MKKLVFSFAAIALIFVFSKNEATADYVCKNTYKEHISSKPTKVICKREGHDIDGNKIEKKEKVAAVLCNGKYTREQIVEEQQTVTEVINGKKITHQVTVPRKVTETMDVKVKIKKVDGENKKDTNSRCAAEEEACVNLHPKQCKPIKCDQKVC